ARKPPGYYARLNQGERATFAMLDKSVNPTEDGEDENESYVPPFYALAAAEREPTFQEALNGPDSMEWQEAIDYEISQLEKLKTWEVVHPPRGANIIPCHYV
ncbi:hypothetical protein BJ138DRAFT_982154, partial [Hygrophoropsis aurantiaca]